MNPESNAELKALYEADLHEHAQGYAYGSPAYQAMRARDRERRRRAGELLAAGGLRTPEDHDRAARIFQHGDTPEEAWQAHQLALKAAELGHRPARWLAAAAYDRWLMYQGRPQKFGTQYVSDGRRQRLWDVEPATSDEERARWDVPPLAEQLRKAEPASRAGPPAPVGEDAPQWLKDALKRWEQEEQISTRLNSIADFAPPEVEAGVGLAIQDEQGRYLFMLAGTRHECPPGEIFYAGIGGHREAGEDWPACAWREAQEEIGAEIRLLDSPATWHLPENGAAARVELADRPRPLALYPMVQPPDVPWAGRVYRIVVYRAELLSPLGVLQWEEVRGVIALTGEQVRRGLERRLALTELLAGGAALVAGGEGLSPETRLYPLGTAVALAKVLAVMES
jgi:hypothetical protein